MKAARFEDCWAVRELNAPVGNEPALKFVPFADREKGTVPSTVCRKFTGSTSTSNIPKPPRTAVLPLRNGSHQKPTRGSKSRKDGLANNGEPSTGAASVRWCSDASWP